MPATTQMQPGLEVLSPRSTNMPVQIRTKTSKAESKPKVEEKPANPDRIDDKWRPPMEVTEPGLNAETYITGKKLGKGGFAVCFEGQTKSRSEVFALKVVKAKVEQKKMMEKFRTELQIHAKMQHPNIVEFLQAFTLEDHTYVVLELCPNGSLAEMVKARSCLSLPEVRRYMIQICGGVKYMHKRSVIHRDLKMGNVFLDSKMDIKIGDFGLAAVVADEHDRRTTLCGTPNYIAPEILSKSGTRGHDNKVDTWAVGVICYAMLMGTPPFQSKTQQEIYTKLRTLEYEWKIDSKNYIPQQAKDFVASCLNLVSAERPEMDELVEYEFFAMGGIADILDTSCLKMKPAWLENADPRGDKVKKGYGISHGRLCAECGVGKDRSGRNRPAVGGKVEISTLVEIELENRAGCAPTIPLPQGILYKQFAEAHAQWTATQKHPLQPGIPRSRKIVTKPAAENSPLESAQMMPPTASLPLRSAVPARPTQSFAAQQRQAAIPQRATARPGAFVAQMLMDEKPVDAEPQGLLRAKPVRAMSASQSKRSAKEGQTQQDEAILKTTALPQDSKTQPFVVELPSLSLTAAARLPIQRPATLRSRVPVIESDVRPKTASSASSSDSDPYLAQVLQPISGNDRLLSGKNIEVKDRSNSAGSSSDTSDTTSGASMRTIAAADLSTRVKHTSSSDVVHSLHKFHSILGHTILDSEDAMLRPRRRPRNAALYPRVESWVDYTRKHGAGYMLLNGTVGVVFRSSKNKSSSCTIIRNAKVHSIKRARGIEQQIVPQGQDSCKVEFFDRPDHGRSMRKLAVPASSFGLDMDRYSTQQAALEALHPHLSTIEVERLRDVYVLDKMTRQMATNMSLSDAVESEFSNQSTTEENACFVHLYQRLGNVSMWRFLDGTLQLNFPDHTKLVIYDSTHVSSPTEDANAEGGILVDLVYLAPADAKLLSQSSTTALPTEALRRRAQRTIPLRDILTGTLTRTEGEIVKSNEVLEKLAWCRAVVGCWIKNGGAGRTGEEKLGWSGMQEAGAKAKLSWVTVGRCGGDD